MFALLDILQFATTLLLLLLFLLLFVYELCLVWTSVSLYCREVNVWVWSSEPGTRFCLQNTYQGIMICVEN